MVTLTAEYRHLLLYATHPSSAPILSYSGLARDFYFNPQHIPTISFEYTFITCRIVSYNKFPFETIDRYYTFYVSLITSRINIRVNFQWSFVGGIFCFLFKMAVFKFYDRFGRTFS